MFKRKLKALKYHQLNELNIEDETQFRNLMLWLEDQVIRNYPIEDRKDLRLVENDAVWNKAFAKYLEDIDSPYNNNNNNNNNDDAAIDRPTLVDWILGYAVRLEYADNSERLQILDSTKYRENFGTASSSSRPSAADYIDSKKSKLASNNPLDALDFQSDEFKAGVDDLIKILKIPPHPDHLVNLKAISRLVTQRMTAAKIDESKKLKSTEKPVPLNTVKLGFDSGDEVLNDVLRVLRLLEVHQLRDVQTKINEAIVAVQSITADPKTNDKLGKVGRM